MTLSLYSVNNTSTYGYNMDCQVFYIRMRCQIVISRGPPSELWTTIGDLEQPEVALRTSHTPLRIGRSTWYSFDIAPVLGNPR